MSPLIPLIAKLLGIDVANLTGSALNAAVVQGLLPRMKARIPDVAKHLRADGLTKLEDSAQVRRALFALWRFTFRGLAPKSIPIPLGMFADILRDRYADAVLAAVK